MREHYFENEYSETWIEDGIMYAVYKPNLVITLEVAKKLVADRLIVSDFVTFPFFVDIRGVLSGDIAARKYLSSVEAVRYLSAGAILTDNFISGFAGNIFMKINKPPIPTKLFTDREKALKWLEQYKHVH